MPQNYLINKFNKKNNEIIFIKGSSYDDKTVEEFKTHIDNIDLLFIDGDHSEKGVTLDFLKYNSFLNKEGYIVFDNYDDPSWKGVKIGVDKLNLETFGFKKIGQIGLIIQKI